MWLLEQSVRIAIEQAQAAGVIPDANQQATFEASRISAQIGSDKSRIMTTAGDTAKIVIDGVLTKTPSFLAMLFGGGNTTYSEIIGAIAQAEGDENIKAIDFMIDSPGGNIDGLFDTLDAIDASKKPTRAIVSNMAASAAYAIATQADKITATNKAARFGSIGILWTGIVNDNEVAITSTNAPKKAPDVTTEKGKAIVREQLDDMHDLFVDAIARGRDVSADKINSKFGQGAVLLADDALKRGMIDSVATADKPQLKIVDSAVTQTADIGGEHIEKVKSMDLNELKAQHPDVYSAVVQVGIDQERERVNAHLHMAKETGATTIAMEAIEKGDGFGPMITAKYASAAVNRKDTQARNEDDEAAAAATAGAGEGGEGASATVEEADKVAAMVESQLGTVTA